jgi:hypothetical protein
LILIIRETDFSLLKNVQLDPAVHPVFFSVSNGELFPCGKAATLIS